MDIVWSHCTTDTNLHTFSIHTLNVSFLEVLVTWYVQIHFMSLPIVKCITFKTNILIMKNSFECHHFIPSTYFSTSHFTFSRKLHKYWKRYFLFAPSPSAFAKHPEKLSSVQQVSCQCVQQSTVYKIKHGVEVDSFLALDSLIIIIATVTVLCWIIMCLSFLWDWAKNLKVPLVACRSLTMASLQMHKCINVT